MASIDSIRLSNIRSHVKSEIKIPKGITFIMGEIGAGKTTILKSIEFGIFGLIMPGRDILRLDSNSGYVELDITGIDGIEYTIHRDLTRKNQEVRNDKCWYIKHDGEERKINLSPTEMRKIALNILGMKDPEQARKEPEVFTYSIYTPQEEMKQILSDSKERFSAIRRIFNMERYKIAADNSNMIKSYLIARTEDISRYSEELEKIKEEIEKTRSELENLNEIKEKAKMHLEGIISQVSEMEDAERRYNQLYNEISRDKGSEIKLKENLSEIRKNIDVSKIEIEKIETKMRTDGKKIEELPIWGEEMQQEYEKYVQERENIEKEIEDANINLGSIKSRINQYNELIEKGICPMCGREIHGEDYRPKISMLMDELQNINKKLKEFSDKKQNLENKIKSLEKIKKESMNREYLENVNKSDERYLINFRKNYDDLLSKEKDILEQIKYYENNHENWNKIESELKETQKKLKEMREREREARDLYVKSESDYNNKEESITKGNEKLSETQKKVREFLKMKEMAELMKKIKEASEEMERNVMNHIREGLEAQISNIFSLLVEDSEKEVFLSDDFEPQVRQSGFVLQMSALSGGERSAVALAYRIALSTMLSEFQSPTGILILDEPTDGFSKEQLEKFSDILRKIEAEQIIVISHEGELENSADSVLKIKKVNCESIIEEIR